MYHPDFFKNYSAGVLALGPLLRKAIDNFEIEAEVYSGEWFDIGTPERLSAISNVMKEV